MTAARVRPADYPLVLVDWVDPAGAASWKDLAEAKAYPLAVCVTVGWLIVDEPDRITLAASLNDDGSAADLTTMPRGVVQAIYTLAIRSRRKA